MGAKRPRPVLLGATQRPPKLGFEQVVIEAKFRKTRDYMFEVTWTNLKDAPVRELFKGIRLRRLWKGEISLKEALIKCLDAFIGFGFLSFSPGFNRVTRANLNWI